MARFLPLPPAFFDPRVSDAELQEQWTAGAEEAVRRLRARVETLAAELKAARADLVRAEAFAADADAVRARYRRDAARRRARVTPVRGALPAPPESEGDNG